MVENAENPIRNSTRGFCRKGGIIYIIVLEFPVNQPNLRFYFNLGAIHGRCKMWYGKVSGNLSQTVYKTGEKFGTKASSCHIPALRRSKKTFPMFPIIEHTVSGRLWRGLLIVTNLSEGRLLQHTTGFTQLGYLQTCVMQFSCTAHKHIPIAFTYYLRCNMLEAVARKSQAATDFDLYTIKTREVQGCKLLLSWWTAGIHNLQHKARKKQGRCKSKELKWIWPRI